jgi:hypothetical protein
MDGMFNLGMYGLVSPKERDDDQKKKRGFFWANRDANKKRSSLEDFDISSMDPAGAGNLDQKTRQDAGFPDRNINQMQKKATYKDQIMQGGTGVKQGEDPNWWNKLANMANVDMSKAQATWKAKGGFEGLMANPAFTMGLAFMQAGAEGKTLGQGALNNVMKAAGVSSHYKKILEDRKLEPIQATSGDIAEVKDMLKSINIEEGNWLENFLGGPESGARYEAAVEEVAVQFQAEIRKKQKALLEDGKSQVIKRTDQIQILRRLINEGKIKKKGGFLGIFSATLQKDLPTGKAQGGQVAKGQPYVVGEGGPEYFLPKESGKILSNDDSRIFSMLLAANPQLQNVSRTRSEKILRNRFPEYFE